MKKFFLFLILMSFQFQFIFAAPPNDPSKVTESIYWNANGKPLVERYVLDEIMKIRVELERAKADLQVKIAEKELQFADLALKYSMTTLSYFFYIIAWAWILFTLVGWKSVRDLKKKLKEIAENEIKKLTKEYADRLTKVENDLREKWESIYIHEKEIQKNEEVHLLLSQAESEIDHNKKLGLYKDIIALKPNWINAYIKKAEIDLEFENYEDVIEDTGFILSKEPSNSMAFYYKACANANLWEIKQSITSLKKAFKYSKWLVVFSTKDKKLKILHKLAEYKALIKKHG